MHENNADHGSPQLIDEADGLSHYIALLTATIIRYCRDRGAKTQQQISKAVGVTQARISQLENADTESSLSNLVRIADATGGELRLYYFHPSLGEPVEYVLHPKKDPREFGKIS